MPDFFGGPTLDDLRKLWAGQPDWYRITTAGPSVEPEPSRTVPDDPAPKDDPLWPESDRIVPVQLGWQCPRCGQCYAPFVSRCEVCVPRTVSSNSTSIRVGE